MYKICKTEESAARQRVIEHALLMAMKHTAYDRITLSSLCSDLKIPRKTLYRYFPTKQDILLGLIDHLFSDCNSEVFFDWDGKRQFSKANLEQFFTFWRRQEDFLDAAIRHGFWPLVLERTTQIVNVMKQTSTEPREENFSRDQLEYFIAAGLMTTVLRWHHMGYLSPPEEMAEVFASVLCSSELSISRLFL